MMVAIVNYNPAAQKVEAEDPAQVSITESEISYSNELDDKALELIRASNFEMVRRIERENYVHYEVYVKSPVTDLRAEAEALSQDLYTLWGGKTMRVLVLNYGDMEHVDLTVETK